MMFVGNDLSVNAITVGFTQVQMNQTNRRELLLCLGTMSLIVPGVKAP